MTLNSSQSQLVGVARKHIRKLKPLHPFSSEEMDLISVLFAIPSWLVVLAVLIIGFYIYYTWHHGYLEKQGVKTHRPWSPLGALDLWGKKHIMEFDQELYRMHGRVYGFYEGRKAALHIGDPDLIKQVTVKDFASFPFARDIDLGKDTIGGKFLTSLRGEEWKMMRTIMTPSFTTGKLKHMFHLIEDCCKTLVENLNKFAESGEPINARKIMSAYTMDVIAVCAFGTKIDSMANPDNAFLVNARKIFQVNLSLRVVFFVLFPKLARFLRIRSFFPEDVLQFFKGVVDRVIEMRKHEKESPRDFLALLLEAQKDDNEEQQTINTLNDDTKVATSETPKNKKVLSSDLITAQSVLFLLAGHETTATLLSYALYLLALHPEIQDKLAEEVTEVTDKHEGKIDYQIMTEMPYVDMVISETLRMYPPATRTERTCVEEGYDLGGVILKKGMVIGIPVYSIHHDPEFYPDPEKFDPERFTPENKANRNPFTYLPFGAGPRNCIASRFALMEAKMTLAFMIKEFTIKKCPQTEEKIEYFTGTGLLQPKSITVAIEKRPKK